MMSLLQSAGISGWLLAAWAAAGMAWAAGWSVWFWHNHDPVAAARQAAAAAGASGQSPRAQYESARSAALAQASTPALAVFAGTLIIWVALLVVAAVVLVVTTPDLAVVVDVVRGRYELPAGGAMAFAGKVSRALVNGVLVCLLLGPAALVVGLSLGFSRCWMLGGPLDRALLAALDDIASAPANAGHEDLPALGETRAQLVAPAVPRWHVSGFLLGPFWYLLQGNMGRLLCTLVVLLMLAAGGHLIWKQAPALAGPDGMARWGATFDFLWHNLRDFWPAFMVLPLLWRIGAKGQR